MSNIGSSTSQSSAAPEVADFSRKKGLAFRDQLYSEGKVDLWKLMQHVSPDADVQAFQEIQNKVKPYQKNGNLASAIEFKRMCLKCGIDSTAILDYLQKLEPKEQKTIEEKPDYIAAGLGLPLSSIAKTAWIGSFFTNFFSEPGSKQEAESQDAMDTAQSFERALVVITLLHDGYQIVKGAKEIAKLKLASEPFENDDERSACEKKKQELEERIRVVVTSHEDMEFNFFEDFNNLMLLKARLEPEKHQEFLKLTKAQIKAAEDKSEKSREALQETVKLVVMEITDVVLEVVDPTGLLKSGVGIVLKTQGLYDKIKSTTKTIEKVKKEKADREIAQIQLNSLIEEALAPIEIDDPSLSKKKLKAELKKQRNEKESFVNLVNVAAKVNRVYFDVKKESHIINLSLSSMGLSGSVLGFVGLACKILVIVGIAAGIIGLMASSFGLAGIVILSLVLAFKAGSYAYKHREEINCQIRLISYQVLSALTFVANRFSRGRFDQKLHYYQTRIEDAKQELEALKFKAKLGQVGIGKIKNLAKHHFTVINQTPEEKRADLSTRVFLAITGKEPKYDFHEAKTPEELQERFIASVTDSMIS